MRFYLMVKLKVLGMWNIKHCVLIIVKIEWALLNEIIIGIEITSNCGL